MNAQQDAVVVLLKLGVKLGGTILPSPVRKDNDQVSQTLLPTFSQYTFVALSQLNDAVLTT